MSFDIRLTQTVQKGGCAAKIAATELRSILKQVKFPPTDNSVLVDGGLFDDAAIYKVSDDLALVQTLDFFTPIVDSPYLFGQIAAANALSDVYAMGGEPKTVMAILAFPLAQFPNEVIVQVLQGASDKITEANANFVGGHSIDDDSLKFGLSVSGFVHPKKVWSNAQAKVGNKLILTKALGTGTIMTALKRQVFSENDLQEVTQSMAQLNRISPLLSEDLLNSIQAATDITGFGFLGHVLQMAKASEISMAIDLNRIPFFAQARVCLQEGHLTKAHRSNWDYVQGEVEAASLEKLEQQLLCDPQTSGGLLLSVEADRAEEVLRNLKNQFQFAALIGEVTSRQEKPVYVTKN
ncbi:MAG: selenide, water dikinase SelD [Bdellovibrionia bacterium]